MSMRTALMEMAHGKKPKTERAAWVPESILDDDVSHFMGAAAAAKKAGKSHFDFGGKKYKVTMKHDTAKKVDESAECPTCGDGECQCEQPVEEAKVDELSKKTYQSYFKKADRSERDAERKLKDVRSKRDIFAKPGGQERKLVNTIKKRQRGMDDARDRIANKESVEEAKVDEVSYKTAMKSYQKAMGQSKDADTAGDKETGDKKFDQAVKFGRYANKKFQSSKNKKKLVGTLTKEETVEVEENYTDKQDASYREPPVKSLKKLKQRRAIEKGKKRPDPLRNAKPIKFESVEENLAPGATAQHSATKETSDTWDKQMSNGENDIPMGKKKDFVDQHNMEVAYDAEAIYKQNKYEALSKTPARPGDKSDGDKNVVNPIPTNMVDGMRAALAKMKNSGE